MLGRTQQVAPESQSSIFSEGDSSSSSLGTQYTSALDSATTLPSEYSLASSVKPFGIFSRIFGSETREVPGSEERDLGAQEDIPEDMQGRRREGRKRICLVFASLLFVLGAGVMSWFLVSLYLAGESKAEPTGTHYHSPKVDKGRNLAERGLSIVSMREAKKDDVWWEEEVRGDLPRRAYVEGERSKESQVEKVKVRLEAAPVTTTSRAKTSVRFSTVDVEYVDPASDSEPDVLDSEEEIPASRQSTLFGAINKDDTGKGDFPSAPKPDSKNHSSKGDRVRDLFSLWKRPRSNHRFKGGVGQQLDSIPGDLAGRLPSRSRSRGSWKSLKAGLGRKYLELVRPKYGKNAPPEGQKRTFDESYHSRQIPKPQARRTGPPSASPKPPQFYT